MASLVLDAASFLNSAFRSAKVEHHKGAPDEDLDHQVRGRTSRYKRMRKVIGTYLASALAEYGPPYEYDDYYTGALLFECSQSKASSLEIHRLLNAKLDPNDVDKEELNFTPMHWCARHCHLNPMKMLVRAKAHVNVSNEFGQSPLSLCAMMKQTLNKISIQMEMAEFLLDAGADIEIRDKGGLSPLDYAVQNGNIPMIQLFLDYGATVRRDNKHFNVQRAPLLDNVTDKKCFSRIAGRLDKEMAGDRRKEANEEAARIQREIDLAHEQRIQDQLDKKERRLEEIEALRQQKAKDEILRRKIQKLSGELNEEKAAKAKAVHGMGSWEKGNNRHWVWHDKKAVGPLHLNGDRIYATGLKLAEDVKERRSVASVNKRWEAITGTKLEVKWESMAGFDEIIEVDKKNRRASTNDEEKQDEKALVLPFDFKDENDAELEGQDLDIFND